ncbi:MAG TPA: ABC transporter permease [Bryobacteraceae bacterium]|nr:ABC transporter permease [Bryobacteraceae bacterium]
MTWTDLLIRVRALLLPGRMDNELDEELDFHIAMSRRKYAAGGYSESDAERLARKSFGRVGAAKEECRQVRGIGYVETMIQDVRYALRTFRRSPGFVLTVAFTIAIGLGLNAALFTLFNSYVLRPIAIQDPYSLYSFTWTNQDGHVHWFTWDEYQALAKHNPAFSEVAAFDPLYTRVDGNVMQGELVSGNFFQMLGIGAALGRTLLPEDTAVPGRDPFVVLSFDAWQRVFAGQTDIIGRKVMIRGYPMQVIGVARKGFHDLGEVPRDFWAPLTMAHQLKDGADPFGTEHPEWLNIVGRLKQGERLSAAEQGLRVWSQRSTLGLPNDRKATGVVLRSRATAVPITAELLLAFTPLAVAFGLVLLLACTNVANMMLARAIARQREIGIRLSLGAARVRLIRQLLTESILLSIPSGILGFAFSRLTLDAGLRVMFATIPKDLTEVIHNVPLPVDWRVLGFMMLAALASAVLFGVAPAIQATRSSVLLAARGEFTTDLRPMRVRNWLVIAQTTVCTLLLVTCGVLIRTTLAIGGFDIGFGTQNIIAMNVTKPGKSLVVDALSTDAQVDSIAVASKVPLGGFVPSVAVSAPNRPAVQSLSNRVSPSYFDLLRIPIVRGRNFTRGEAEGAALVAIVSAATVPRLFGNEEPLGKVIHISGKPERDVRIVGVSGDLVTCCIPYGKDAAMIYFPSPINAPPRAILVHVRGNVEEERNRLAKRLDTLAPGAIDDIHSLDQYLAAGTYPFRAASLIGIAVAGVALLLTVSGIYGVLSYLVMQRTKEIGIRMALGATAGVVTGFVLKQSLRLTGVGMAVGMILAVGVAWLLASQVVFMRSVDLPSLGACALLVLGSALAAAYIPSRRAARIDPIETLRYD